MKNEPDFDLKELTDYLGQRIAVAVVVCIIAGFPAFILYNVFAAVMCQGGNGPNTTYCM